MKSTDLRFYNSDVIKQKIHKYRSPLNWPHFIHRQMKYVPDIGNTMHQRIKQYSQQLMQESYACWFSLYARKTDQLYIFIGQILQKID